MSRRGNDARGRTSPVVPDRWLLGGCVLLLGFGLVMVASASMPIAARTFGDPLHYFWRQAFAACLGIGLGLGVMLVPLAAWYRLGVPLLAGSVLVLVLVLVPGVGREVNGAMRWIALGPLTVQGSEMAKLGMVVYLAGYLVRHGCDVRSTFSGVVRPMSVVTLLAGLLLLEPDYGAAVVLFGTALGMLFLGGVSLSRFVAWTAVAVSALAVMALAAPYRMQRLLAFVDPWADPYDSGFQLTQALIALGRGGWFGVGLGRSVQKLFYLPEVHNDFVFAVVGEELGLAGALAVIALFAFVVWRAFQIGGLAERNGLPFGAYLAYGIGLVLGAQAFFHIGVNLGVLPTKGLTLPLVSYGSNALVTTCVAVALLLRVQLEASAAAPRRVGAGRWARGS